MSSNFNQPYGVTGFLPTMAQAGFSQLPRQQKHNTLPARHQMRPRARIVRPPPGFSQLPRQQQYNNLAARHQVRPQARIVRPPPGFSQLPRRRHAHHQIRLQANIARPSSAGPSTSGAQGQRNPAPAAAASASSSSLSSSSSSSSSSSLSSSSSASASAPTDGEAERTANARAINQALGGLWSARREGPWEGIARGDWGRPGLTPELVRENLGRERAGRAVEVVARVAKAEAEALEYEEYEEHLLEVHQRRGNMLWTEARVEQERREQAALRDAAWSYRLAHDNNSWAEAGAEEQDGEWEGLPSAIDAYGEDFREALRGEEQWRWRAVMLEWNYVLAGTSLRSWG